MQFNISLKNLNTWHVGGKCKKYFAPTSLFSLYEELPFILKDEEEVHLLGGGSNVLISDEDLDMTIINTPSLSSLNILEENSEFVRLEVTAGFSTRELLAFTIRNNLTGLEVLTGIPGTIGGALWGNAGAAGADLSSVLEEVELVTRTAEITTLHNHNLVWKYRQSPFVNTDIFMITKLILSLEKTDPKMVRQNIQKYALLKRGQPLAKCTAGCVFKNPPKLSAGKLLDSSGCKGMTCGDAMVSYSHANFIENIANATSNDILKLSECCRKMVYEKYGVELEYEIQMLGYF
ncbi:MAG: UDP-N-acetylmuramate dehydrogenase [Synergistaceae bacterium]